jgi:hypothetical protein
MIRLQFKRLSGLGQPNRSRPSCENVQFEPGTATGTESTPFAEKLQPTARDNGIRSRRKLPKAVVRRLLAALPGPKPG